MGKWTAADEAGHRAILASEDEIRAAIRDGLAWAATLPEGPALDEVLLHCAILDAALLVTLRDEAARGGRARAGGGAS
jgi:hypothetical protein